MNRPSSSRRKLAVLFVLALVSAPLNGCNPADLAAFTQGFQIGANAMQSAGLQGALAPGGKGVNAAGLSKVLTNIGQGIQGLNTGSTPNNTSSTPINTSSASNKTTPYDTSAPAFPFDKNPSTSSNYQAEKDGLLLSDSDS